MNLIKKHLFATKRYIKEKPKLKRYAQFLRFPISNSIGIIYGAYLTLRYVDKYTTFPAISFKSGLLQLCIRKGLGSQLNILGKLTVQPLGARRTPSLISLGDLSIISINSDFFIGDDVQIVTHENASIQIGGRMKESASGISAKCLIHAQKSIKIGQDVLIAQDTLITDSDWHPIEGSATQKDVVIGNHVWIATNAKILKGSNIGNDCILGCSSVVSKKEFPSNSLILGVPARIVKSGISKWARE